MPVSKLPTKAEQVADVVQKQRRKRPDLSELQTPHCEPGEISRMLSQALTISHWPKIDSDDPDQVSQRIDQYHMYCIQNDIKPDVVGMALALGVSRKTVWAWENGVDSNKPQSVRNVLKKGRQINELMMVQMMENGKINPVTAIFLLKNSHEYRDQTDLVISPNNPADQGAADDVKSKFLKALPETTE